MNSHVQIDLPTHNVFSKTASTKVHSHTSFTRIANLLLHLAIDGSFFSPTPEGKPVFHRNQIKWYACPSRRCSYWNPLPLQYIFVFRSLAQHKVIMLSVAPTLRCIVALRNRRESKPTALPAAFLGFYAGFEAGS